jgi:glucan biosynthesis protein C
MSATAESAHRVAHRLHTATIGLDTRQESRGESPRFYSLDAVRSGMMLLGIFYHASSVYYFLFGQSLVTRSLRNAQTSVMLIYIDRALHIFRMPIFFVMAGFFGALLYTRRGPGGVIANRARRVLVPLAVAWLLLAPAIKGGILFAAAARSAEPFARVLDYLAAMRLYDDRTLYHLWFLYDLLIFYTGALVVTWVSRRIDARFRRRANGAFRRILQSTWRPVLLGLPTIMILEAMPRGDISRDLAFVPDARVLFIYSMFFAFGWLLYGSADLLPSFARHAPRQVALAALLFPVFLAAYGKGPRGSLAHLVTSSTDAMITWLCLFGLVGLAVRYLDRPTPMIRYLSDASYWLYLVHYPLVIWIAGALSRVEMAGALKVLVNLAITVSILLISYHYWVRPTFIGEWLNGRRAAARRPLDPHWQSA